MLNSPRLLLPIAPERKNIIKAAKDLLKKREFKKKLVSEY